MARIELAALAWKAKVLPLYDTRSMHKLSFSNFLKTKLCFSYMVEGGGFEPPKAMPADLQSAPFGRSGTPPAKERGIVSESLSNVNHHSAHFQHLFHLHPPGYAYHKYSRPHQNIAIIALLFFYCPIYTYDQALLQLFNNSQEEI